MGFAAGGKCATADDCASRLCVAGICQSASDAGLGGANSGSGGASSGGGDNGGSIGVESGGAGTGTPAGSACKDGTECSSGKCSGGLCMPSVPLPNTTCTTGADCASGVCKSGTCEIPAGATGTVDQTDCAKGSLGCACQPMNKCKPGLTCTDAKCCNAKTGSCSSGTPQTGGGGGGGDAGPTTACQPGVVGPIITECGYPYASANPLTDILFNESDVLAAIVPSGGYPFARIQLFYNDEHAMTLGVRETVIDGVTTDFPLSALTKSPDIVDNPTTGTNLIIGHQAGVDPVGRPMWPALFITDITQNRSDVSGDWQWGGNPVNPTYVAGTWKGAVRTVDATGASITPDADPTKNNQDYGNGDTAPAGSIAKAEAYGAEVRWDLRLEPGHNYRFQVMVHDGDQNKVGGDSGEACITFCAGNTCPGESAPCDGDGQCTYGNVCVEGCCLPPPPDDTGSGSPDGGACPAGWKTYVQSNGVAVCSPPVTNGTCPPGYVVTIQDGQQYCTKLKIPR
ncbi:MAG TPA: hypothetical protein VHE30_26755 [Polyangiaceae bacterium]|nr:hypothetical protein [Polyangiaceae bacterium]